MYKWSSYIRMSMYSWRQAKITVNSGAKMIDKCQASHALVGVSWLEELHGEWGAVKIDVHIVLVYSQGYVFLKEMISTKKPKLLTTSWAIWHRKEWENMKNVDEDVCRLLNKFQNNLVSRTSFISQSFVSNIFSFSPKNLDIWGSIHRQ